MKPLWSPAWPVSPDWFIARLERNLWILLRLLVNRFTLRKPKPMPYLCLLSGHINDDSKWHQKSTETEKAIKKHRNDLSTKGIVGCLPLSELHRQFLVVQRVAMTISSTNLYFIKSCAIYQTIQHTNKNIWGYHQAYLATKRVLLQCIFGFFHLMMFISIIIGNNLA